MLYAEKVVHWTGAKRQCVMMHVVDGFHVATYVGQLHGKLGEWTLNPSTGSGL